MNKKWYPYLLIGILLIALVVAKLIKHEPLISPTTTNSNDPASAINRDHGFDRRTSFLEYSKHAACRMECRHISKNEVEQIMNEGKINYAKSDLKNTRCPRYALEGRTVDGQRVRIIFAQCNSSTAVVTVIDLETDFECHCPGDKN